MIRSSNFRYQQFSNNNTNHNRDTNDNHNRRSEYLQKLYEIFNQVPNANDGEDEKLSLFTN
jgi:hypothetical protein